MNHLWRVYIKPFNDSGNYVASWIDVSDDVDFSSLGAMASNLDNTEFDIGVYRSSNFKITLNNTSGKYSDVDQAKSIFRFKRADSLVRVTWQRGEAPKCGYAKVNQATLTQEVDVFVGLLNDDSLAMNVADQRLSFQVLGRESIFLRTIVPFGTISNGMNLSEVIYNCLNQPAITKILTVSQSNINVALDQEIDSIASLQNKTVQEGLNKLLLATNSVLYVQNDTIYVAARTPTASSQYNFYGQGSPSGPENVSEISSIKNGSAKLFNYFSWKGTTTSAANTTSTNKYGARKKELDFEFITDTGKRLNIMNALLSEFSNLKQEFDLVSPVGHGTIGLRLLDRVSIDYPNVYLNDNSDPVPICGIAICGEAVLPYYQGAFTLEPTDYYKIIGRSVDPGSGDIKFKMRAI